MHYEDWNEAQEVDMSNATTLDIDHLPVQDWCFDILLFYESMGDKNSMQVLSQLMVYAQFSFFVNGVITCTLAIFGLIGNALLFYQINRSCYFSHRLGCHLGMLCVWDMMLLFCCLVTYGVISLYYKIIPFVGLAAYILFFFQPFASFCVTGTIWQVLAITIERYMAVSHPLEQQTRKARFSVKWICAGIAICAFLLNMTAVPFERYLKRCYEFLYDGQITIKTMIVQRDIVNNQYYAILVHLIPDLLFRAPSPIILIATLTVRTLQIYKNRRVGTNTIQANRRRNIPFMLTLLNIKFILCNTLYMFNTILMEVMGYGGKSSSQQTDHETIQYIRSLYLTDLSNMLIALHSATNWLLFYHWTVCDTMDSEKQRHSIESTSTFKSLIDPNDAYDLLVHFSPQKYKIGAEIITRLCSESKELAATLVPNASELEKESLRDNKAIQAHGKVVADFIESALHSLACKLTPLYELQSKCRQVGMSHFRANVNLTAVHWKLVRDILVLSCCTPSNTKWTSQKVDDLPENSLQRSMMKAFNVIVSEIKKGSLCAAVDSKRITHFHRPIEFRNSSDNFIYTRFKKNYSHRESRLFRVQSLSPRSISKNFSTFYRSQRRQRMSVSSTTSHQNEVNLLLKNQNKCSV